jgi:hypothetical protein
MYHGHINIFGHTKWTSYVMWNNWKLVLLHSEIALISMQDSFTVCAKRATSKEIFLATPDGPPR